MGTQLSVGVHAYEHTQALFDGRVAVDGVDAVFETAPLVSDIFRRAVEGRYDLAELGLTCFLRTFDLDDAPFLALPILPNRNFRHSAIFVNTAGGIEKPQDLAGRTIGEFALYGHDAGIWPKGILADEYGVRREPARRQGLARAVYDAFMQAKELAEQKYLLRGRREPQGHRHLLALPPRTGPVEAPIDVRGHLRTGTPRHLSRAATTFRGCRFRSSGPPRDRHRGQVAGMPDGMSGAGPGRVTTAGRGPSVVTRDPAP
ncbi:hypothetical protein ACMATS_08035 [Streptoverticillium reticulum]|uniref:hypothetical protein n=1 Tax=Streptoverticillium reticulum TaxID=1433415 RepID=UPI0039BFA014